MERYQIKVTLGDKKPDRKPLAGVLFQEMVKMMDGGAFSDPELEAEFQEWQKEKTAQAAARAAS